MLVPLRCGYDCKVARMWNSSRFSRRWFVNAKDTGMAMQLTVPGVSGWEMGTLEPTRPPTFVSTGWKAAAQGHGVGKFQS